MDHVFVEELKEKVKGKKMGKGYDQDDIDRHNGFS